jgi:hypothetical protein
VAAGVDDGMPVALVPTRVVLRPVPTRTVSSGARRAPGDSRVSAWVASTDASGAPVEPSRRDATTKAISTSNANAALDHARRALAPARASSPSAAGITG